MSEVLASLKQKGGSGGVDLSLPPDATYTNASMANNATANITVSQMPKLIAVGCYNMSNSYGFMFAFFDVTKQRGYRYGYWNSAFHNEVWDSTNRLTWINSITSSNVAFTCAWGSSYNSRVDVGIYY